METWQPEIKVTLPYEDNGKLKFDLVSCQKIGGYYMVTSVPAFAGTVALGDIVLLEEDNGYYFIDRVVSPSGHTAVHISIKEPGYKAALVRDLNSLGVQTYFPALDNYLVADVPVDVPRSRLANILADYAARNLIAHDRWAGPERTGSRDRVWPSFS
ncbi:MAG: DUF4265 domain-containing protein [Chitinophagaceae bacterium]|nr:MAG: DUF4265 domain-containing protein [Chitinophagaceae bacterium]